MAPGLEWTEHATTKESCSDKKQSVKPGGRICGEGKTMGSRRIFAPQFKLQVLDSYRKDADCRGNQRATARKYGIHRRQIQKWLQVEASLRTAVEVAGSPVRKTALNLVAGRQHDDSGSSGGSTTTTTTKRTSGVTLFPRIKVEEEVEEVKPQVRVSLFPNVKVEVTPPPPPPPPVPQEELPSDEDEELDVEEDMDPGPEQALDFSCAALGKRRSFSLQFKLEVLNAFHSDKTCRGNQRATARKFGINRRQVQKWLGQEPDLRGEAAYRGGLYRQRLGRWLDDGAECWDLSTKRKHEEPEQETALCLVKVERRDQDEPVVDLSRRRDPPPTLYAPPPPPVPTHHRVVVVGHGHAYPLDLNMHRWLKHDTLDLCQRSAC